jgi:rhodanese-related sulfurtransferase
MKEYNYSKYTLCSDNAPPKVDEIQWKNYIDSHSSSTILDVRPSNLYIIVHFVNSKNIPLEQIKKFGKQEVLAILGTDEK